LQKRFLRSEKHDPAAALRERRNHVKCAEPTESCNDMVTNSVGRAEPTESCNDTVTNSVGRDEAPG
jgi:hypothetical protein